MTTTIKKTSNRKKLESFSTEINNAAGHVVNVRNDLTLDIRNLIRSANRGDARMMLRELSETIAEIRSRVIHLNGIVSDLENLRDKVSKLVPDEMKN